jgi:hypothetical protein
LAGKRSLSGGSGGDGAAAAKKGKPRPKPPKMAQYVRKPDSKSHAARLFYWEIRGQALAANGHDVDTKKAVLL